MTVRVRFAPSPTGPLHIGGVRTALFNYLFARKHGGTFILRIEDTDQTRYVEGAEDYIADAFRWLGITIDEGHLVGGQHDPYRQSERADIYLSHANQLIESGWGYYAFDTPEELDAIRKKNESEGKVFTYDSTTRSTLKNSLTLSADEVKTMLDNGDPYVIRFKFPENREVVMQDIIRGTVKVNTQTLDDKVLFKSDGLPTYHMANVVDDHLMEISHVIRGEEWLPSLPLHVLLYEAFGWTDTMPQFAHLPLILKPEGKGKLSKRDGDKLGFPVFPLLWTSPEGEDSRGYREDGYLPEAVINMLALLGWNPGTEQEIFSLEELCHQFDLERVSKSGARFDPDKAKWFNHQHITKKSDEFLALSLVDSLSGKDIIANFEYVVKVVSLVRDRLNFTHELWDHAHFFFENPAEFDEKIVKKRWKSDLIPHMQNVSQIIAATTPYQAESIKEAVSKYIETNGLGFGAIANALRLALVGSSVGPDLFAIVETIGAEACVNRINFAIENIDI
ncbi:MAG: glutamate--tRNA ligase [Salinivirgaceae bacterium]|nr:glutamate--tRNA ligase [Salinivirgaceae bacterium]